MVEIVSILIHLRENLHSGAEYGWAMPSCVPTVVVDCCFCLEILFVVAGIKAPTHTIRMWTGENNNEIGLLSQSVQAQPVRVYPSPLERRKRWRYSWDTLNLDTFTSKFVFWGWVWVGRAVIRLVLLISLDPLKFKPAPPGAQENLHATYGHLRTLVAYKLRTGNNFLQWLACSLMLDLRVFAYLLRCFISYLRVPRYMLSVPSFQNEQEVRCTYCITIVTNHYK